MEDNYSRKALQMDVARNLPSAIKGYEEYLEKIQADVEHVKQHANLSANGQEIFKIRLNDQIFTERTKAGQYLNQCLKDGSFKSIHGEYKGMKLSVVISQDLLSLGACQLVASHKDTYRVEIGFDPVGNMSRLEHCIHNLPRTLKNVQDNLEQKKHALETAKKELARPWPLQDKLDACLKRSKELDALLLQEPQKQGCAEKEDAENGKVSCAACR